MFTSTLSSAHVGEEGEIHIIFAKFACVQFKIKVSSAPNVPTLSSSFSVIACYETFSHSCQFFKWQCVLYFSFFLLIINIFPFCSD